MKTTFMAGLVFLVLTHTGCTQLKVTKVTDTRSLTGKGIRYSLPKPFIQFTTSSDGSKTAEIVYIPDSANTYEISSQSILSNNSLTIGTENGLLKKLNWSADSAAVVAEGVKSFAAVQEKKAAEEAKEAAERKATADKKTAADEKAASDAAAKLAAANKAVADAYLVKRLAESDLAILGLTNDEVGKTKARMALEQAKIKLDVAEKDLAQIAANTTAIPGADDATNTKSTPAVVIPGPVLYAVFEDQGGTRLIKSPTTVPGAVKDPLPLSVSPGGVLEPVRDKNGQILIELTASKSFEKVEMKLATLARDGQTVELPRIWYTSPKIFIGMTGFPSGSYVLMLPVTLPSGKTEPVAINFVIVP